MRVIFTLLFIVTSVLLKAQQVPMYNQYNVNSFLYNPAFAGQNDRYNTYFIRNQRWTGFEGGAVSNSLTFDGSFFKSSAFGVQLNYDRMGIISNTSAKLSYAHHFKLNNQSRFGIGVSAGMADHKIEYNRVRVRDLNDPSLPSETQNQFGLDANAGIYFNWKDFYVGLSVPQLIGWNLKYIGGEDDDQSINSYRQYQHFLGTLRYDFKVGSNKQFILTPNAMVRYIPNLPIQFDGGFTFTYDKIFWINATYRHDYAISGNLGFIIKDIIKVGYAYEYPINSTVRGGGVNQEFLLGFTIKRKRGKSISSDSLDYYKRKLNGEIQKNTKLEKENKNKDVTIDSLSKIKPDTIVKIEQIEKVIKDTLVQKHIIKETIVEQKIEPEIVKETVVIEKQYEKYFRYNKDDKLKDLDKNNAPVGYYLVYGVYSSVQNCKKAKIKLTEDFDNIQILDNERNNLFYVILYHSKNKGSLIAPLKKARGMGYEKAWVLDYRKPE